jgi:hypothetical protein
MEFEFSGKIFFWRGPSPYFFVAVPDKPSAEIKAVANRVTYGWGVIPVEVRIGQTEWTTSLFPKDGRYLVPIKVMAQRAEDLHEGDKVTIRLKVQPRPRQRPPGKRG